MNPFLMAAWLQIGATAAPASLAGDGFMPLFNGKDMANFYTFRQVDGKNNDPEHVFKIEDGMIHMLDMADITQSQPNGYMATNNEYRNYHLRLEYKWGEKKLPVPRHPEGLPRDAGLLFHIYGPDSVWPQCVEFQIQEHDTGDIWLLNKEPRPTITATSNSATTQPAQRFKHSQEFDSLTAWNTVDLYATENEAVYVVNGHVNNGFKKLRIGPDGAPITQGKIALQEENSEVFYRNVQIKPLFATGGGPAYKVLVFTKTAGFKHASIPNGVEAIKLLGEQNRFTVDATDDATAFTEENLKQYKAVVFMSTTGDVLNDAQQSAFEKYIHSGGGYVGVHAASDTEYDWPWYGQLVGAYFSKHPSGTPTATVRVEDADHPSTSSLPSTWTRVDEWYNFKSNPRQNVHVLVNIDESSYKGGDMNGDHPITWYHDFEGGRAWYTAMGHTKESYSDPLFLMQLMGGIEYAAGRSRVAPHDAIVLFDGKDASQWLGIDDKPATWPVHDGVLESPATRANDIHTRQTFEDFQLHAEFKVPATNPPHTNNEITNEQARGNSGIYLQGRYECQILDSFDHPLKDLNDEGAIYSVKDALVNASQPAETWQMYDITFHAAKWNGNQKTANARATVYLNGVLVQDDTEIPHFTTSGKPEGPEPGPIMLQDHLNSVQFRNIWIKPLKKND
ncbi:MAG TPA: ThuA domain-containing protein [Tepidisphaeraceae bacterium]|nr:ThuA domain-containing protein [Tepidisphaeraceae bacterium]